MITSRYISPRLVGVLQNRLCNFHHGRYLIDVFFDHLRIHTDLLATEKVCTWEKKILKSFQPENYAQLHFLDKAKLIGDLIYRNNLKLIDNHLDQSYLKRLKDSANHEQTKYQNSSSNFNYFQYAKMLKEVSENTQTDFSNTASLLGIFNKWFITATIIYEPEYDSAEWSI